MPSTHDLLELDCAASLLGRGESPGWVASALARAPWVVVRRSQLLEGWVPVGVRGTERSERWATVLAEQHIRRSLSPADLLHRWIASAAPAPAGIAAFDALYCIAHAWRDVEFSWGPAGSVGFSLATEDCYCRPESDLDIVLEFPSPISRAEAHHLLASLPLCPVRIDVLVETPACGFSLKEFACSASSLLLRTTHGPCLGSDPWDASLLAIPAPSQTFVRMSQLAALVGDSLQ